MQKVIDEERGDFRHGDGIFESFDVVVQVREEDHWAEGWGLEERREVMREEDGGGEESLGDGEQASDEDLGEIEGV